MNAIEIGTQLVFPDKTMQEAVKLASEEELARKSLGILFDEVLERTDLGVFMGFGMFGNMEKPTEAFIYFYDNEYDQSKDADEVDPCLIIWPISGGRMSRTTYVLFREPTEGADLRVYRSRGNRKNAIPEPEEYGRLSYREFLDGRMKQLRTGENNLPLINGRDILNHIGSPLDPQNVEDFFDIEY